MSCERENSNNTFLAKYGLNNRLSVDCNHKTYTQEMVLNVVYLPCWKELSKADRYQCIIWVFDYLLKKLNLETYLDNILFIPKAEYEDAFSSYDKEDRAIFINPKYIEPTSLLCIWNLFHEFEHVIQHRDEDLIKEGKMPGSNFYDSFAYYFMYDGTSYRFRSEEEFVYRIKQTKEFCRELYLRNPMEIDANEKAYSNLKKIIECNSNKYGKDNETTLDLNRIRNMWFPKFKIITDDIAMDVIKYCQILIELSYQFSKDKMNESEYNKKIIELYAAIKILIEDKKRVLSN